MWVGGPGPVDAARGSHALLVELVAVACATQPASELGLLCQYTSEPIRLVPLVGWEG